MSTKKQASWCRAEVPDDLRVTFVASKSEDALLHSYLGSLRFGTASKEVRRLLSFAIRNIDVPDKAAAAQFIVPAEPKLPNRHPLAHEENPHTLPVAAPMQPAPTPATNRPERLVKNNDAEQEASTASQSFNTQERRTEVQQPSSAQVSEEDLAAIRMLDAMSGD